MWRAMLGLVVVQSVACGAPDEVEPEPERVLVDGADCDPAREVCRRTLRCDFDVQDGLELATGIVRSVDQGAPRMDIMCVLGRFVGLQSSELNGDANDDEGGICAMSAAFEPELFDDVEDVPADASLCVCSAEDCWGTNILCGVYTSPFTPACAGHGFLVRVGARGQLYRLRIETDLIADSEGSVTFDYVAVL